MSTNENSALVVREDGQWAITASEGGQTLAALLELGIDKHELPQVKVPSGGAVTWEVPLADGIESTKELDIIIAVPRGGMRRYFATSFEDSEDGGSAPDCSSDSFTGENGMEPAKGYGKLVADEDAPKSIRECQSCPKNQWKSAGDGKKGKGCGEYFHLIAFVPGEARPIVVHVPPTSLKACKTYIMGQISKRGMDATARVVTTLKLRKEPKPSPHSVIEFQFKEELGEGEAASMKSFAQRLNQQYPRMSADEMRARDAEEGDQPVDVEVENDAGEEWVEAED